MKKQVRIKSVIIVVLFLMVSMKTHTTNNLKNSFIEYVEIDTYNIDFLYQGPLKSYVQETIGLEKDSIVLKNVKEKAINYAKIGNAKLSVENAEKYIKVKYNANLLYDTSFQTIENTTEYQELAGKYLQKIDFWTILFIIVGIMGTFFSVIINLRKKRDKIGNLMISLFVLFHSLFSIHIGLYLSRLDLLTPHLLYFSTIFSFLYGPLLYLYFKRITFNYQLKKIDILHLLPSLVLLAYLSPIYMLSQEEKLEILYNRYDVRNTSLSFLVYLKYISLSSYAYLVYRIFRKKTKKNAIKVNRQVFLWKRNIMVLYFLYVIIYIFYGLSVTKIVSSEGFTYSLVSLLGIIILYVGYIAYIQPDIFDKKYVFEDEMLFKYKKSGLTNSYSEELKNQLLELFLNQKIYRNNNLTLKCLADKLGATRHNVSQVINEHFEMNFFQLVNKYRVLEAIEILRADNNRSLKIIDIAYDVGFNNKVTFNRAFKSETQMTPSEFLEKEVESV